MRILAALAIFFLVAAPAARAEALDVPETVPPPIAFEDLPVGRIADLAIPIYRAVAGVGAMEGEVVRGSGVTTAATGLSNGLQYRIRWEATWRRAAHRAHEWAAAEGPQLRMLIGEGDAAQPPGGEAEWEAVDASPGPVVLVTHRILRIGRFVADLRGARADVLALADRLREMARVATDATPGLLARPARGVYLAADPVPVSDRVRLWVHGRNPGEIRLERVRLRLPQGLVTLGAGEFRVVVLSDRIEVVVPDAYGAELSRAQVWAEGKTTDGVPVRTER